MFDKSKMKAASKAAIIHVDDDDGSRDEYEEHFSVLSHPVFLQSPQYLANRGFQDRLPTEVKQRMSDLLDDCEDCMGRYTSDYLLTYNSVVSTSLTLIKSVVPILRFTQIWEADDQRKACIKLHKSIINDFHQFVHTAELARLSDFVPNYEHYSYSSDLLADEYRTMFSGEFQRYFGVELEGDDKKLADNLERSLSFQLLNIENVRTDFYNVCHSIIRSQH